MKRNTLSTLATVSMIALGSIAFVASPAQACGDGHECSHNAKGKAGKHEGCDCGHKDCKDAKNCPYSKKKGAKAEGAAAEKPADAAAHPQH